MIPESFNQLQELLKSNSLPDFPTLNPHENVTTDMNNAYEALYRRYLNNLKELKDNEDFNEYLPLVFDFISAPIPCTYINEIEAILAKEEEISDIFDAPPKTSAVTEFKTAKGESVKADTPPKQDTDNYDRHIIERIENEIIDNSAPVSWDDIAGLENVKKTINEIVVWPVLRPDVFKGIRNPPKGVLLFGPPGTGKTMIGKCVASQCKATFFSISASSLTSKWVGEGERTVRALFMLARKLQPSVVFIDEIDSLLSQRTENENEASRRIKTEFLVQFDGVGTNTSDSILIIGATNRPSEIDEAARRRLVKRIYVPLPDFKARRFIISNLTGEYKCDVTEEDLDSIAEKTDGYSGSDLYNLCREVSMEPIREIADIRNFRCEDMRPINANDFMKGLLQIRKSVSENDLEGYCKWNQTFGSM